MADAEDKEKAEKVAAARKRYEQLKKQKAKEKKGGAKRSKVDKPESDAAASTTEEKESKESETKPEDAMAEEEESKGEETKDVPDASLSQQSRMRSESFKRQSSPGVVPTSPAGGVKSPTLPPLSAEGDAVQDIYRQQAARIEALEKENKRLEKETSDLSNQRSRLETEIEDLREAQGEAVESKSKGGEANNREGEAEKLLGEISSLQRQNSYLKSQAKEKRRTSSITTGPAGSSEAINSQLANKINTIESLELELSNLRHSVSEKEAENTDLKVSMQSLESELKSSRESASAITKDLDTLRTKLETSQSTDSSNGSSEKKDNEEDHNTSTRIHLLTSDLAAAQRTAADAITRAQNLEKKMETLTALHREIEARLQQQLGSRSEELERVKSESGEMRKKLSSISNENARLRERRARTESAASSSGPAGEDHGMSPPETTRNLQSRIRTLEAENFDLKRGVWREKRMELQEGDMPDDEYQNMGSPNGTDRGFDDVDLSPPAVDRRKSSPYGAFSGFFSSITGGSSQQHKKQTSRPVPLSGGGNDAADVPTGGQPGAGMNEFEEEDDMEFDEEALRLALEEQGRKRLERVREIKRGLNEWKGWRMDLVDLRGGEMAGVVDI